MSGLAFILLIAVTNVVEVNGDCRRIVSEALERGVQADQVVALHGTSVQTVRAMLLTERIPTGHRRLPETSGYFYFFPNSDHPQTSGKMPLAFYVGSQKVSGMTFQEAFNEASGYALDLAWTYAMGEKLGLDLSNPDNYRWVRDRYNAWWGDHYNPGPTLRDGYTEDDLVEAAFYGERFKGVVLGLSPSMVDEYGSVIQSGSGYDVGVRISAPNGIPIRHLQGIKPLGNEDARLLRQMLESSE